MTTLQNARQQAHAEQPPNSSPMKNQTPTIPDKTSHTPGPWTVTRIHPDEETNKSLIQIFPQGEVDGPEIAAIYCAPCGSVRAANARLIASSPDLLAALEAIHAELSDHPEINRGNSKIHFVFHQAKSAITNATNCSA